MKTYLLSTIESVKKYSMTLDAKSIISNKSWIVFNDSGQKEVYIFKPNGLLRVIVDGAVASAKWEFEPANNTFILTTNQESWMVHPAFVNSVVMAFQIDGTEKYSFLIDESNVQNFAPKTLSDLKEYFIEYEKAELKKIEDKKKRELEIAEEKARHREIDKQNTIQFIKWMMALIVGVALLIGLYYGGVFLNNTVKYGYKYACLKFKYQDVGILGNGNFLITNTYGYRFLRSDGSESYNYRSVEKCRNGYYLVYVYKSDNYYNYDKLYGVLDSIGNPIIPLEYTKIDTVPNGILNVHKQGYGWTYLDYKGKSLSNQYFDSPCSLPYATNLLSKNDTLSLVDQQGKIIKTGFVRDYYLMPPLGEQNVIRCREIGSPNPNEYVYVDTCLNIVSRMIDKSNSSKSIMSNTMKRKNHQEGF